ncbi:MAG: nitrogen fixation protein NifQ [Pseudomonadota bacterium]|nr:nitrogen fixation protein NifQ [Pseudomonadota bacterium]
MLRTHTAAGSNPLALAQIVASHCAGEGALPPWLGLDEVTVNALFDRFFPGLEAPAKLAQGTAPDTARAAERADLRRLLMNYGVDQSPETGWIASLLVDGSMGPDHLWRDLGLWNRGELSALIQRNFPELFARNEYDMKWKKFFYKQLCDEEGIYTCRAPSCEYCPSYLDCYGSEED